MPMTVGPGSGHRALARGVLCAAGRKDLVVERVVGVCRDENALHRLVRLRHVSQGLEEWSVLAVRQKRCEVDSDVGNSLFAQHVLNGMNVACGHELHAEDALVAHVPILIGKQHGDVEGRKLVDLGVL